MIRNFNIASEYSIEDMVFYPYKERNNVVIEIILLTLKHYRYSTILRYKIRDSNIIPYDCNYVCSKHHSEDEDGKRSHDGRHHGDEEDKDIRRPHRHKNPAEDDEINKQCVWDLIESIAMIETAMSHILNTEGEKLQKAVEISNDLNDLLEINRSINKTITNATLLENALYTKLDALIDLCRKSKLNLLE